MATIQSIISIVRLAVFHMARKTISTDYSSAYL